MSEIKLLNQKQGRMAERLVENANPETINEDWKGTILSLAAAGMLSAGIYNSCMKRDDLSPKDKEQLTTIYIENKDNINSIDKTVRNAFARKGFTKTGQFLTIDQLCEMSVEEAKKEVASIRPYIANYDEKLHDLTPIMRKVIDNYGVKDKKTGKTVCKYKGMKIAFDPEFMIDLCAYCDYDLPLLLAQLQCESIFGVTDIARTTNSLFSVGIEDSGIKSHGRYPSQDYAMMRYIKLMQNHYLTKKKNGHEIRITPEELLRNGNFVNRNGNRYASDTQYEKKIRTTRNKYISLGFGNTWLSENPHKVDGSLLSMNEGKITYARPTRRELHTPGECKCWNCNKRYPYIGTESPMVTEKIWNIVAPDEPRVEYYTEDGESWVGGGFLCKDCMEKRLGRELTYDDMKDAELGRPVPFNKYFVRKYFPEHYHDYDDINFL